jgi:prepilin-type N-terminal cleavage/methylation domain-containing protein
MGIKRGKKSGFSLAEILIVVIIISILSGVLMLLFGGSSDKAEAVKLAADLDNLRSALVTYSNENRGRNQDPFGAAVADATIKAGVAKFLARPLGREYLIARDPNGTVSAVFSIDNPSSSFVKALDKVTQRSQSIEGDYSGGTYKLSVRVR